jgi:hypothetical protein
MLSSTPDIDGIAFTNSPIEFVISGPLGGRDRILARSQAAGLDLIGLAAQSGEDSHVKPGGGPFSVMLGPARQLNSVTSFPMADLNPEFDARGATFTFAWKGYVSAPGIDKIKEAFNASLPELHHAIRGNNAREAEWVLSPVIYCCTQANERGLRMRRVMWAILAIYSAAALAAILLEVS